MKVRVGKATLELLRGDITRQQVDAVVNAANPELAPGGGVAGAIHRAAGPGLWEECRPLGPIGTGEAVITGGHALPARFVIHTVGPVYSGSPRDPELLARCYRGCLRLAAQHGVRSLAFPALSTGAFGYPLREAARVALPTLVEGLPHHPTLELLRLVLWGEESLRVHQEVLREVAAEEGLELEEGH